MLYYKRRQERDRLFRVGTLSPMVSFPIGPSRRVCLLISSPFYGVGLVVLPITAMVFIVRSFLTTGKEYTHADKAVGRLTVDRHWRFGNRRAADIVDWDNRSPSVFETGSVGAAPTSTARLIFENRNVIILRGNSIG